MEPNIAELGNGGIIRPPKPTFAIENSSMMSLAPLTGPAVSRHASFQLLLDSVACKWYSRSQTRTCFVLDMLPSSRFINTGILIRWRDDTFGSKIRTNVHWTCVFSVLAWLGAMPLLSNIRYCRKSFRIIIKALVCIAFWTSGFSSAILEVDIHQTKTPIRTCMPHDTVKSSRQHVSSCPTLTYPTHSPVWRPILLYIPLVR